MLFIIGKNDDFYRAKKSAIFTGIYLFRVIATDPDTPETYAILSEPKTVGGRGITFIKIE